MQDLKGPYPAHWQDMKGKLVTPGLIDCHTHLIFAGSRAEEFELRQKGVPYAEIARKGGGIISTVRATRAASEDQLFELALPRVKSLIWEGVTTVEIKSGYGLTLEDELKMLRVARRLGRRCRSGSRPPCWRLMRCRRSIATIPTPGSRPSARRSSGRRRGGPGRCGGRLL